MDICAIFGESSALTCTTVLYTSRHRIDLLITFILVYFSIFLSSWTIETDFNNNWLPVCNNGYELNFTRNGWLFISWIFLNFGDPVFIIQPQTMSTTVSVNPKLYDSVIDELKQRYGMPEDKGQYGQIYRCWIENAENETGRVSITCYKTTHNISVQGTLHYVWTSTHLRDIEKTIHSEVNSKNSSSCLNSHVLTSTPKTTSCQLQNISTQSLDFISCSTTIGTQTEITTCSIGTQTDVSTTAAFPCAVPPRAPSDDSVVINIEDLPMPPPSPSISISVIIDIPTDNMFNALELRTYQMRIFHPSHFKPLLQLLQQSHHGSHVDHLWISHHHHQNLQPHLHVHLLILNPSICPLTTKERKSNCTHHGGFHP